MNIHQVSYTDASGGADRAASRIHRSLLGVGVDSTMHVVRATLGDPTVATSTGKVFKALGLIRPHLGKLPLQFLKTSNSVLHSTNILPSSWSRRFNRSNADVVHLHWVCAEMMSIEDIGRINKPIVWTLHDMWAFCGAEHYACDERWREGYTRHNRPAYESGLDVNRWTWKRKCKAWHRPMNIATPSRWLADCVKESVLMHDWPVTVIPNALDMEIWKPIERVIARQLLRLPEEGKLLAFGAIRGISDPRKGNDLLLAALNHLRHQMPDRELVVFGERRPREVPDVGFPIHYAGHLYDDLSLRVLYSAADALVIPSRQDNLPNTGVEALACGTPVIAFDVCGLPDIVTHQQTGWLARPFDTENLAEGIRWVLEDDERRSVFGKKARKYAEERFAAPIVAKQYKRLYEELLARP